MSKYKVSDYDYVVKIIQFLEQVCGIFIFITSKDFDVLYDWWEKGIPVNIIKESLTNVVERWEKKNKRIMSLSNFSYEVRKNFSTYLQFHVGADIPKPSVENDNPLQELEKFLKAVPAQLQYLKRDMEHIFRKIRAREPVNLESFYEKLNQGFREDKELNIKVKVFKRHLSAELQKPEIERRYRLNYLLSKFNIPDLQLLIQNYSLQDGDH